MADPIMSIKILYDLFEKLVKNKQYQREEVFQAILTPIYEQLSNIHSDYHRSYLRSANNLPRRHDSRWQLPGTDGYYELGHVVIQNRIQGIKDNFSKWRAEREYIRDNVRMQAAKYFTAVKGKEEKRFLFSVVQYFLERTYALDDDRRMDETIQSIIKHSGETQLDTPSTRLSEAIREEEDPEKLHDLFKNSRNQLNENWGFVTQKYVEARVKVLRLA